MTSQQFDALGVTRVADCHHNTCVANVAALLKNREAGQFQWSARTIQDKNGLVREPDGTSNVGTIEDALAYIEKATQRRRSNTFANFQDAKVVGDYAIFMNAHVVYGIIEPGCVVSILDGNVQRGWTKRDDFLTYAKTVKLLYGPDPGRLNRAYRLLPVAPTA